MGKREIPVSVTGYAPLQAAALLDFVCPGFIGTLAHAHSCACPYRVRRYGLGSC